MTEKEKPNITDEVIQAIEAEFGAGSVTTLGAGVANCDVTVWAPTGSLLLDLAIGHGLPAGRLTEVYGDTSTGKSTLVAHVIGEHQKSGGVAVLFDTESGFLPDQARRIGVDVDKLIYAAPSTLQEVFEMIELSIQRVKVSKDTRPLLIVWDSVAATPTKEELEGEFGKQHMGLHARLISQAMRKITTMISKENVILLFVNQIRTSIGVTFGDPTTTLGGMAIPFHSSVRMQLKRSGYLKDTAGETYGILVKCRITKNKVSPPFREAEIHLEFDKGIVDAATWINWLVAKQLIGRAGAWYTFKDPATGADIKLQYNSYLKKIQEDEAFKESLKKIILDNYYVVRT